MTDKITLPNGITLIHDSRPGSGMADLQVYIKSGARHEKLEENGLTFLTQESANGGTATLSRTAFADKVESLGGSIMSATNSGTTFFSAHALARHAEETFKALAEMVISPALEPAEIEKTKTLIRQWISDQQQSPAKRAGLALRTAIFGGQGAGLNPMGTVEKLDAFTPEQVRRKHAELLAHPENIVVAVSGDVSRAAAEKMVLETFGALPKAATPRAEPVVSFTGGDIRAEEANDQTQIRLSFRVPLAGDDERYAAVLLEEYLAGGMSAPLFQEVREKRGLVYDVGASFDYEGNEKVFTIAGGAGKGNAGEMIGVSVGLFGALLREGVPDEALEQARARILRSREQLAESAGKSGLNSILQLFTYGHLSPIEETRARLAQVTSDDIRRLVAKMMDGPYALAAVGPQETMPAQDEIKALMKKQTEGVVLPKAEEKASSAVSFAVASQKDAQAESKPKVTVLKNGLKIVTLERPGTLSCGAWVGAGADHETPELNGATHMNEHMMFKGTPSYAPGEIDSVVEGELGGGLNAYTSKDMTAYYFYGLEASALDTVANICGEMVFKANIDQDEFNGKNGRKGERDVVIEELRRANDNVSRAKWEIIDAAAYPDQTHGRTVLGTEKTLRGMTADMLRAYRDAYYAPNNVTFVAVGPVRHEDFVASVEAKFGGLKANPVPPLPEPVYKGGVSHSEHAGAKLCNIALAAPGTATVDKNADVYDLLGVILGDGASSRLYRSVVDARELAGNIDAGQYNYRNGGLFYVSTSVTKENIKPLLKTVYAEIRALTQNLTQAELDKAKIKLETERLSEDETNQNACNTLGTDLLSYGKAVSAAEKSAALQAVTLEDVKRAAAAFLTAQPTLATVVPKGTEAKYLPTAKELIALRDGKGPKRTRAPSP